MIDFTELQVPAIVGTLCFPIAKFYGSDIFTISDPHAPSEAIFDPNDRVSPCTVFSDPQALRKLLGSSSEAPRKLLGSLCFWSPPSHTN
jgi:hypothetical protein